MNKKAKPKKAQLNKKAIKTLTAAQLKKAFGGFDPLYAVAVDLQGQDPSYTTTTKWTCG